MYIMTPKQLALGTVIRTTIWIPSCTLLAMSLSSCFNLTQYLSTQNKISLLLSGSHKGAKAFYLDSELWFGSLITDVLLQGCKS